MRDEFTAMVRAMLNWEVAIDEKGKRIPRFLKLEGEAYTVWQCFATSIEENMRPEGCFEIFQDWAGKAPGAAARIAGVLHGIQHAWGRPWDHPITAQTMDCAVRIMSVIAQHSLSALDLMGSDPTIASSRYVWNWICRGRRSGFSVRVAFNALRGTFNRVEHLKTALTVLEERGYIIVVEPEKDGPGRKPSPIVRVRPDICREWR